MPTASAQQQALKLAARTQGVTTHEIAAAGIHRQALTRLMEAGKLERIVRSVYRLPDTLRVEPIRTEDAYGGRRNSRMKDYFDLRALAISAARPDEQTLAEAIAATFTRRATPIPEHVPTGLSDEFARDADKLTQWAAFLGKNRLEAPALAPVVVEVRSFVAAPLAAARRKMGTS